MIDCLYARLGTCYRALTCEETGEYERCDTRERPLLDERDLAPKKRPKPKTRPKREPSDRGLATVEQTSKARQWVVEWTRDWCSQRTLARATGASASAISRLVASRPTRLSMENYEALRRAHDAGLEPRDDGMCGRAECRRLVDVARGMTAVEFRDEYGVTTTTAYRLTSGTPVTVPMEDYEAVADVLRERGRQ